MVNVARQIDLGSDPDDNDEPDSTSGSSPRPPLVDNDAELEIELEKNRRRRVWWEVVYYDLCVFYPSSPLLCLLFASPARHCFRDRSHCDRKLTLLLRFISDSMNHPPLIAPAYIPLPSPSTHPPTPLREYLTSRQLDPTSLLYDTSAPYTTLLPNSLNDGAGIMSEFELRCRCVGGPANIS